MQVEPVGLLGHRASLHQLHDDIERFVELAALVLRVKTHLDRVIDERARPYAEHGTAARHIVELHHAAGESERIMVRQGDDAGAKADVAWGPGSAPGEKFPGGKDLETPRGVLPRPRPLGSLA